MEFERALRVRRMVRAFRDQPIPGADLAEMLDLARKAPSAGQTASTEFVVLTGTDRRRYWDTTLPGDRRTAFSFPALIEAGALVLLLTRPDAYRERYAEPDKARTGLGAGVEAWPVPFWWVDAGAVAQNLLLIATNRGLGACLFGTFDHETAVRDEFEIPPDRRIVAVIALGYPDHGKHAEGRSARRGRPDAASIIHWGNWNRGGAIPE
ncbi:MAG: nitroreductase family protein [Acidimicrobiales bacterium]|nr:nitroreductase family protein [Acidimicrobiales bacterium]